jgi:hypothetical protein
MTIYIVLTDDCNENDCGCFLESIESVWLDEKKATERANQLYNARVYVCESAGGYLAAV